MLLARKNIKENELVSKEVALKYISIKEIYKYILRFLGAYA
jgi:hypothetical protein